MKAADRGSSKILLLWFDIPKFSDQSFRLRKGGAMIRRMVCFAGFAFSLFFLFTLGCGGGADNPDRPEVYSVTGAVTQGGQPVEGASVVFHPVSGSTPASGTTDASGQYTLTTFDSGDGAAAGEYRVSVKKYAARVVPPVPSNPEAAEEASYPELPDPKSLLPEKYANGDTSGLTATVSAEGPNTFDFQLQ
jgi:hypothetical protein